MSVFGFGVTVGQWMRVDDSVRMVTMRGDVSENFGVVSLLILGDSEVRGWWIEFWRMLKAENQAGGGENLKFENWKKFTSAIKKTERWHLVIFFTIH